MNTIENECIQKIKDLFEQYKNDDFVEQRIKEFIFNILPNKIDTIIVDKFKREVRREYLDELSNKFIQTFLTDPKNQYFYIHNTDKYIHYDGTSYTHINSDNILYNVLKSIKASPNKELQQWKYKIKTHILKLIKERNILKNIPETSTIQNVISLLTSTICINKHHAKFFLTILGDNILNKSQHSKYFIVSKFSKFMDIISDMTISSFKYAFNPIDNFRYRYIYSHHNNQSGSRILKFENPLSFGVWRTLMKTHFLDFINVAAHYSLRFGSADEYANTNPHLREYIINLNNDGINNIISDFKTSCLVFEDNNSNIIEQKQMYYLWKAYLREKNLPIILNSEEITLYIEGFNVKNEQYEGVKSNKNSYVTRFIDFWKTNLIYDDGEKFLEIGELYELFIRWLKDKNDSYEKFATKYLNEELFIDVIKDFDTQIEFIDNKYVDGMKCLMWDKRCNVLKFLEENGFGCQVDNEDIKNVYKTYCQWCKKNNAKIVSINYFRYVAE